MLSVVCPIYNEQRYITRCIESILEQDFPKNNLELFFVDGMSSDNTRNIVKDYCSRFSFIKLLDNPNRTVPFAMNIGIKAAKGDIIIRLDAHAEYPNDYFSKMVYYLRNLENAENVGGICITLPCNKKAVSVAISEALSCSFGMGNSYFRIGSNEIKKVDTVPFGCFKKELFDKIGYYDEDLIRNQDDEFNGRIIKNGGSIYLIPSVEIKYFARDKIKKVWNMFYQYGLYKPLVNKKLGGAATVRQFFPVLFVLGIILGAILSCFVNMIMYMYFAVLILYTIIGTYIGIKTSIKHQNPMLSIIMPFVFFVIHFAYGWGYFMGLYKTKTNKSFKVDANR